LQPRLDERSRRQHGADLTPLLSYAASLTLRWEAAYGGHVRPHFQPLTVAAFVQIEVSSLKRVMH